uniref:Uncharacterized protein n=1 Tax=Molossus molossus TaxID=27622 RepID=A0A7J8EFF0_MOLMO|nr:hypothetical protein HJG59_008929 [Molossus molossus]
MGQRSTTEPHRRAQQTFFKKDQLALAGLAQRLERWPAVLRDWVQFLLRACTSVAVCARPWLGRVGGNHSTCPFHVDVSLSLSLSPPPPLPTLSEQKNGKKCPQVRIKKKKASASPSMHHYLFYYPFWLCVFKLNVTTKRDCIFVSNTNKMDL